MNPIEQLFAKLKALLRKVAAYTLKNRAFTVGSSLGASTKSPEPNALDTSQIQDMVNLNRQRSKETAAAAKQKPSDGVAIVSYDEKPGIQAIATTAPDLSPDSGLRAAFACDHEYKRNGTASLLAGIDLLTGKVHALVRDRHRSREFIEFLKLLDAAYPAHTPIKLILDNHSAHISKETKAWLADQPAGRFEFTFTPKHGSWRNLVEGFFSKLARSVLRHIRVTSKQELKDRIMAAMGHFNRGPVVHAWSYELDQAA